MHQPAAADTTFFLSSYGTVTSRKHTLDLKLLLTNIKKKKTKKQKRKTHVVWPASGSAGRRLFLCENLRLNLGFH